MEKDQKQKTILIAEDDKQQSEPLKIILEKNGFKVLIAEDGKTCIDLFNQNKPDLILLDVMLPELSGVKVLEEIRKIDPDSKVPIIVISNLSSTSVVSKIVGYDVKEYFVKSDESLENIVSVVKNKLNL